MSSKIVWLRGTQIGREFELTEATLTIGRSPENTIAVGSGRASRRHAEVRHDPGGYLIVDLESANGTLVNGTRINEPYRLHVGDLFEIGDELFRFESAEPTWATTRTTGLSMPELPAALPSELPDATAVPVVPAATPTVRPAPVALTTPMAPPETVKRGISRGVWVAILIVVILLVAAIGVYVASSRAGMSPTPIGLTLAGAPSATLQKRAPVEGLPAPPAAWTVLVYLAGDNDLEADALRDINEMELVGSSDQLHIVVQFDRAGRTGVGDRWASTRRYLIERDDDQQQMHSTLLQDLGELNTGDPQNLADFLVWGLRQYPARHTALIIWDHGSAWAGTAFDISSANDGLSLPELQQALTTAQTQLDGLRLDVIGFDACLMGQLDVLLAVAPYANVLVASAELEPSDGWDWGALLERLNNAPNSSGADVGRAAVETYGNYYGQRGERIAMLAAFDGAKIADLAQVMGTFADAVQTNLDTAYRPLAEARSYASTFSQPRPEEFSAVDLGDLMQITISRGAPDAVTGPARAVLAGIQAAQIARWNAPFHANASGLSVYFPQQAELLPPMYDQASPLAQQTSWARMLRAFITAGDARVSAPKISDLRAVAESAGGITTLTGHLVGRDIAVVYFFVGIPFADRSGVQLVEIDALQPTDSTDVTAWGVGPYTLQQRWDSTQWGLESDGVTIPVLLGPARPGTDLYGVEGLYEVSGGSVPIQAAVLFRVAANQASFLSVYGFPRDQGQAAQPFELQPASGDRFTTQIRTYALSGAELIVGRVTGESIMLGTTPLRAVRIPAASGNYVAGFLVRDIVGRLSYQYVDVAVGP